jgi:hypothetical protein
MTDLEREELLSAYLDGEVTADERARVEAWLAGSAELRQLRDELLAMRSELQALPKHVLDRDLGALQVRRTNSPAPSATPSTSSAKPPAAGSIVPGTLAKWWERGSGARRLLWPAIAVAAALIILVYDANQRTREQQVALAPPATAESSDLSEKSSGVASEEGYGSIAKDATIHAPADAASSKIAGEQMQSSSRSATAGAPLEYKAADSTGRRDAINRNESRSPAKMPLNAPAPAAAMPKAASDAPPRAPASDSSLAAAGAKADAPPTIICPVSPAYLQGADFEVLLNTNDIDWKRLPVGREQELQVEAEQRVSKAPALQSLGAAPQKSLYHLYASGQQVSDVLSQVPQATNSFDRNSVQLPRMTAPQQKLVDEAEQGVQVLLVAPSEAAPAPQQTRPAR